MSRSAFVYYRVARDAADAVIAAVQAAHAHRPGLDARVWRRVGDDDTTLMESYERIDEARFAALDAELRAALAPWLRGERHVEWFEPCA